MHPLWAKNIKMDWEVSKVPFHFKQWGEFAPIGWWHAHAKGEMVLYHPDSIAANIFEMQRVGKKEAGNLLNGKVYQEFPPMHPVSSPNKK